MIRSIAFNVFFYGFTALYALVVLPLALLPNADPLQRAFRFWGKAILWGMRVVGGMKIEMRGLENLPPVGKAALIAGKHQSECDAVVLTALVDDIAFVAMKELFSYPAVGPILYKLGMIRVDTCGGGRERRNLAAYAQKAADEGRRIAIFPEGNLMAIGEKERYRTGIYHMARDLDLPVTPMATCVGLLWNRRDWTKRAGRAAVQFLPPLKAGDNKAAFMAKLEEVVEHETAKLVSEFSGRPYEPATLVLRSEGETSIAVARANRQQASAAE